MLFPSSETDGAEMKTVELEKHKINENIPASNTFGICPPNNDASPSAPVIATNTPITSMITTPLIVLMRYAGVVMYL